MTIILDGTKGTSTPGLYSNSTFTDTFTDGIVVDYTTGTGRISVGTSDGLSVYNGGVGSTALLNLTSGGNLGLGVTPSAWNAGPVVQIGSGANYLYGGSSNAIVGTNSYYNSGWKFGTSAGNYAVQYQQVATSGQHQWFVSTTTGTTGNAATLTQAMTLDASGNLGVGTSSPSGRLHTYVASGNTSAIVETGGSTSQATYTLKNVASGYVDLGCDAYGGYLQTRSAVPFIFYTNATERARIDSSGNLLVGTTSALGTAARIAGLFDEQAAIGMTLKSSNATTGGAYQYFLNSSGSLAGSIGHTGSTTVAYNTSSDQRLKEDKGVATDTSVVDNTIVHDFEWKADGKIDRGVFAQEAHQVKPSAVSVGSDELTEDGNLLKPWSVDYSKYVPDLIVHAQQLKKQVQEQQAIIQQLQADVETLKG